VHIGPKRGAREQVSTTAPPSTSADSPVADGSRSPRRHRFAWSLDRFASTTRRASRFTGASREQSGGARTTSSRVRVVKKNNCSGSSHRRGRKRRAGLAGIPAYRTAGLPVDSRVWVKTVARSLLWHGRPLRGFASPIGRVARTATSSAWSRARRQRSHRLGSLRRQSWIRLRRHFGRQQPSEAARFRETIVPHTSAEPIRRA